MNSILINNWNSVVKSDDIVYFLGDFAFVKKDYTLFSYFLSKLNGKKFFIKGNHDKEDHLKQAEVEGLIVSYVGNTLEFNMDKYPITLTHYPMLEWNRCYYNGIQLFGHIHNTYSDEELQNMFNMTRHKSKYWYNVGIDNTGFIPISWQQIKENIEKRVGNN